MDKRLFIIEAMDLFQNTRLQKSLYTLHPITCNIDKHKDCAGLGVGSALTPRPNQTLTLTPTLRLILPFFQRKSTFVARLLPPELRVYFLDHLNLSNKFDKEMACIRKPKEGEQGIRMKSGEIVSLIRHKYPSIKDDHSTKIHLGMAMKELGFEGKTHGNQTYYKVIPLKAA